MYVDTHLHLSKEDYADLDMVITSAELNNVSRLIVSCCEKKAWQEGIDLAMKYKQVYLSIGFHPQEVATVTDKDISDFEKLVPTIPKLLAIGEIGLDYHYEKEHKLQQQNLFIKQLQIAKKNNLPVVIHSRDAVFDTIQILKKYPGRGVIHCFSGSLETAREYIKLGYSLGIGGVVTFKNSKLYEVIEQIDLKHIVLETDSPYLAPVPVRGTINEPKNIPYIAQKIAEIKNISQEEVMSITTENAKRLFDFN